MATTDELTERLVRDLKPVKRQRLGTILAIWLGVGVLFEIVALWVVGLRGDLDVRLPDPAYTVGLAGLVAGYVVVSWMGCGEAFPGRGRRRPWVGATAVLFATFVALGVYSAGHVEDAGVAEHLFCCLRMVGGALIPTTIMLWMTSRLAPLNQEAAVVFTMIAATISVMIAAQLNCPYESPEHVLVGHGVMVVAVNGATYALHRAVFRRLAAASLARRTV